jgi:LmbE family N-acetylglucosaminyl deacetylase
VRSHPFLEAELRARALIVAPHPDDEALGCGGLVALKRALGAEVSLVFMTDGVGSHKDLIDCKELREQRRQEAQNAARILDVPHPCVHFFDYEDGHLGESFAEAEQRLAALVDRLRPEQIFVPIGRQEHPDHVMAGKIGHAVVTSLRPTQTLTVFEYPIWFMRHWPWVSCEGDCAQELIESSLCARMGGLYLTLFGTRVDIRPVLDRKRAALAAHVSQMERRNGDPRWNTLGDLCQGDFLATFFHGHEVFHRVP